jgi:Uma2 family endonuclease
MALPKLKPIFTVDEYLKMERAAEERHLFLDGLIFAMAGESLPHGIISVNLVVALGSQLKGKLCQALTKDTKVRSGPTPMSPRNTSGMFSYPDIVVVCGEPEFHDAHMDIILNPTVIVEVLSSSTEGFDRGEKFSRYKTWNPTLKDYLLVSQQAPQIEHYTRQTDDRWSEHRYSGLEATVIIASIDCALKLTDVYDRVIFGK